MRVKWPDLRKPRWMVNTALLIIYVGTVGLGMVGPEGVRPWVYRTWLIPFCVWFSHLRWCYRRDGEILRARRLWVVATVCVILT